MAKIILEQDVKELLLQLKKENRVIAPILKNPHSVSSRFAFAEVEKESEIELSYPTTILPPKEYLLPPADVLFSFNKKEVATPKTEKTILFGLSLEDIAGVRQLTKIFETPIKDEVFFEKKENTIIIGVDKYSPPKEGGFDLYLMRIKQGVYAGFAGTKNGQKILKNSHFKEKAIKVPKVEKKEDKILAHPNLAKILAKSKDHPIWDELAQKCFGCGICSYVCPLCYCFEAEDMVEFGSNCGARCRNWDSCMLKNFAAISSHNFRGELKDRIYNWYFHKFVRMPREYGFSGCVDCNRCVIYCPAKINYHQVLSRIIKDSKVK